MSFPTIPTQKVLSLPSPFPAPGSACDVILSRHVAGGVKAERGGRSWLKLRSGPAATSMGRSAISGDGVSRRLVFLGVKFVVGNPSVRGSWTVRVKEKSMNTSSSRSTYSTGLRGYRM
jgi:hypothetical protein